MTFAFIERQAALPFCEPGIEPTAIANPLSEKFAVLRPSLLPGLIDSCAHNRRRGRKDVQLFETGSRFTSRWRRTRGRVCLDRRAPACRTGRRRRARSTSSMPRASSSSSASVFGVADARV